MPASKCILWKVVLIPASNAILMTPLSDESKLGYRLSEDIKAWSDLMIVNVVMRHRLRLNVNLMLPIE